MRRASTSRGFTLVELLVSTVITALVAAASTVAMSQMLRARTSSRSHLEAFERARAAAEQIGADAMSVVRDSDLFITRVSVVTGNRGSAATDELMLVTRSATRIRQNEYPEGGDYEVAYKIVVEEDGSSALWRRADPALDDAPDAGGVIRRVARGIVSFNVEIADSESWFDIWDTDYDGLPHALRISITALSDDGRVAATARRVVAIDRVPLPEAVAEEAVARAAPDPVTPGEAGT